MPLERLGPYRLEREVGRGGMGAVYAGVDESTGSAAAIKVLAPHFAADPTFRERFETEIETLKLLRHPNIVQLYGYGEDQGQLFYSMELVDGVSLQDELTSQGPLDWREVVKVGVAVSAALKHAHDRGVIHRDLKPANLLRDRTGNIKLTDFGIAKLFGGTQLTAAGGVMGTADYMAPEQAAGKSVTPRVDLYSLGAVLYALLAGRPPFLGGNLLEVLDRLRHEEPTPVHRLTPGVPRELSDLVQQLLAKDPQARVPTALALGNRLRAMDHALSAAPTRIDPLSPHRDDDFELAQGATAIDPEYKLADEAYGPQETAISEQVARPVLASRRTDPNAATVVSPSAAPGSNDADRESVGGENRFTTVDEAELGRRFRETPVDTDTDSWWKLALGAAALVLLVAGVWFAMRPASAAALLNQIDAAADSGDPLQLAAVEGQLREFVTRFDDHPRHADVAEQLETLELDRLTRRLERQVRRGGAAAAGEWGPIVQLYLQAMEHVSADPHETVRRLTALIDLYGGRDEPGKESDLCLELAGKQLARLEPRLAAIESEHRQLLAERLAAAEQLVETDRDGAAAIWLGVIELYGGRPWAEREVAQARQMLAKHRWTGYGD